MTNQSRRKLLKTGLAAAASRLAGSALPLAAQRLHLPLGLQLYSVREYLPQKFEETLNMIGEIGYREVEAAGFYGRTVKEVKHAMENANLKCVSAHYGFGLLSEKFDESLAFVKELGVSYLVCASTGHRHPVAPADKDRYTLDDWYFVAEQLNVFGEKVAAAGLRFAYHNHFWEFAPAEQKIPYHELMARTNPAHVDFEMDCGWVVAAGANPVDLLRKYPSRISMLHVKDFARPATPEKGPDSYTITELGRGYIDYRPILRQATAAKKVQHIFVEQEGFDIPVRGSLTVDAQYMRGLLG